MSVRLSSVFPRPSATDPDDVVWTLQTAAVQWQRGLRADAIVWVRKAADTAVALGQVARAEELRDQAARLAEFLWTDPEESALASGTPVRRVSTAHRATDDDDDEEVIEVEELEGYELVGDELEFTENDLPTPDDAVADIAAEDLEYHRENMITQQVLPDDLDLRSDSQRPPSEPAESDSYASVSPEPEGGRDSYLSVSPEPEDDDEDEDTEGYISVSPESLKPAPSWADRALGRGAPVSERPTQPHMSRPSGLGRAPMDTIAEPTRIPTVPAPSIPPRPRPPARSAGGGRFSVPRAAPAPQLAADALKGEAESGVEERFESAFPEAPPAFAYVPRESPPAPRSAVEPIAEAVAESLAPPVPSGPPVVDGLDLESVEVLSDLPEEAQAALASSAELVRLADGKAFVLRDGAALVTKGKAHVTLTFSDVSAGRIGPGAIVASRGSVEAGPLRLIADSPETHVVRWSESQLSDAMRDCPWVADDLRLLADRYQAHASAGLGPLGQRLDDSLRAAVYERLEVRVLAPGEVIAEKGKPLKGLFVMATGEVQVGSGTLRAGEFLFPSSVFGAEPAPDDVRAGPKGALVLFATRPVAHELMISVPPLLELLAG